MKALLATALLGLPASAWAQQIDMSRGGPLTVTAQDGLELRQAEQEVIARGHARAVRDTVTVDADELIAHYRKKAGPAGQPAAPQAGADQKTDGAGPPSGAEPDASGNEIYRVEAAGDVQIYTPTDRATGDRAVYDIDQAVLVLTGKNLKLTTPNDVLTARDSLEYWAQRHMAVARGAAVVVTSDAKRLAADTLVAYTEEGAAPGAPAVKQVATGAPAAAASDPLGASGKLKKMEAFGHVSIRTATEIVTGDRAVYVPDTGIARLGGDVRITRGQNQLNGSEAEVNMKSGISRLISGPGARVQGLVLPNDPSNKADAPDNGKGAAKK